ncbi:hypothetical protein M409DRAFT_56805 [Zasmidium cellare ATCC 36951]|uniref:C2H2-type domain-containing protein n=1 Tax=Zasmidium cellare ATCC 36951 TaxID=1080233 RepID=A0A6A6CAN5_ZASCE|nr:uncharacterized protein M409DRAFT_56805 [Zasmidium cellare ATCC 36951]KAF2164085.1 hypothetical protein M409DRAFT_56805 [Zasmidium cellare ATCC 36951]
MGRQYTPDLEAQLAMRLMGFDSSIGTDHFNDALPTIPNTPMGETLDSEERMFSIGSARHQGSDTGLRNTGPYYHVLEEVQRVQGADLSTRHAGSSASRSGSVISAYIYPWALERNASQTPTLASGSSRSDSGGSDESTPVGTPRSPEHYRLPNNLDCVHEGSDTPTPPRKPVAKVKEGRPQRASELQRDRLTCYCDYGCEKVAEDGTRQKLSFTRGSDWTRHYDSKHNPDAEIFHCPECTYKKTRLDKVRKHWRAKHAGEGKVFKATKTQRVVPDRLRGRIHGTWG